LYNIRKRKVNDMSAGSIFVLIIVLFIAGLFIFDKKNRD